jgi:hypothetical protein
MVWLGNNLPYAAGGLESQLSRYGETALADLQGYIWIKNDIQGMNSPPIQSFIQKWKAANRVNPTR